MVYAGSSSAYGGLDVGRRREDDPVTPRSPYAAAKLAGELYCQSFTTSYGLETVRLRFFNVFGPRQRADSSDSGVIPRFIASLLEGKRPLIHGTGEQSRDFTYVSDVVAALEKAALTPDISGRVYNIGGGGSISILALLSQLNLLLGTAIVPEFGPPRPGDVLHSQADLTRAQADLGYKPKIAFLEGLRRTLESFHATRKECLRCSQFAFQAPSGRPNC